MSLLQSTYASVHFAEILCDVCYSLMWQVFVKDTLTSQFFPLCGRYERFVRNVINELVKLVNSKKMDIEFITVACSICFVFHTKFQVVILY
jgi:hypothetical protein